MKKINFLLFIFLILTTTIARADVSSGLVAWWPFNESQGYEANDLSGNGYNIWIDSPNWASASNGHLSPNGQSSLIMNGTNYDLKTSTSLNLNGTTQVTVSLWFYYNYSNSFTNGQNYAPLFISGISPGWSGPTNAYAFYVINNNASCGIQLNANMSTCFSSANITTGWHHYVAIFNNAANNANALYIDGQSQSSSSNNSTNTVTGQFMNRPLYFLNGISGQIYDVRVYSRALAAGDIQTLYNLGAVPPNVLDAPGVSISTPSSGVTISGRAVTLTANVSDSNASITAVQFQLNGNNIGSRMTVSPYTTSWDSTSVANGNYILTAQAFNSLGQVTTATIPVTVANTVVPAPAPTTTWPVVENVLDYGAKGDAVNMTADTVAGSTTITIDSSIDSQYSLSQADVGKIVELFQVGQQTSSTTNMDLLTQIVSVTDASHAVLAAAPGLTARAARCIIGSQNSQAFQNAVDAVSNTTQTIVTPQAPSTGAPVLSVTPGSNQVALSWTAVTGASSYVVQRSVVSGGPYTIVNSGITSTTFTDSTAANGTLYYYEVEAKGSNIFSAAVSVEPQLAKASVPVLTVTAGNNQVVLSWAPVSGATGYYIERSATSSNLGPYMYLNNTSGYWAPLLYTQTSYIDTSVTNGTTYYYKVQAVTSTGTSQTIIYIPAGRYLLVAPVLLVPNAAIPNGDNPGVDVFSQAGISFVGENRNKTILLDNGACMLFSNGGAARSSLFLITGPFTSNAPVDFTNLTMDGGVAQGYRNMGGFPASTLNGDGWDITHDAILTNESFEPTGTFPIEQITNVTFTHFRGEIVKSIINGENSLIDVENCSFIDGNADSFNQFFTHTINNSIFDNVRQVDEFWEGTTCPNGACEGNSIVENSTITNAGHGVALTGADTRDNTYNSNCAVPFSNLSAIFSNNSSPIPSSVSIPGCGSYTIYNNTIDADLGVYLTPATRVLVSNNRFTGGLAIMDNDSGYQSIPPYGDTSHDILIEGNYFENVGSPITLWGGDYNVDVVHNMSAGPRGGSPLLSAGSLTNDIYSNNYSEGFGVTGSNAGTTPQWFYDDGTSYNGLKGQVNGTYTQNTDVSYASGLSETLVFQGTQTPVVYTADDSSTTQSMMPANVVDFLNEFTFSAPTLVLTNGSFSSQPATLYTSLTTSGLTPISIPVGQEAILSWTGTTWQKSIGPEASPTVTLTSPSNNTILTVPGTITLNATAADTNSGGAVAKVDFYINTYLVGTVYGVQTTYSLSLSNVTPTSFVTSTGKTIQNAIPGQYLVQAKVTDNAGMTTFSSPAWVTTATNTYPLAITIAGSGYGEVTGTNIDCGVSNNECTNSAVNAGTTVTLTATPSNGGVFAGWSGGGCSGMQTTCTVTMNQAQTVTATFNSGTSTSLNPGCVSGDSPPSIYDAELTAQASVNLITFTSTQLQAAEVDGTGKLDIYDAFLIAEYAVNLITTFPVQS